MPGISCRGKGGRCVGLTTLPPSCADFLNILGASTSGSPRGLYRPVEGHLFTRCVGNWVTSSFHPRSAILSPRIQIFASADSQSRTGKNLCWAKDYCVLIAGNDTSLRIGYKGGLSCEKVLKRQFPQVSWRFQNAGHVCRVSKTLRHTLFFFRRVERATQFWAHNRRLWITRINHRDHTVWIYTVYARKFPANRGILTIIFTYVSLLHRVHYVLHFS